MFAVRVAVVACMVSILSSLLITGANIIGTTFSESWQIYTFNNSASSGWSIHRIDVHRALIVSFYVRDSMIATTPPLSPDQSRIALEVLGGMVQISDFSQPDNVIGFQSATTPVWSPLSDRLIIRVDRHLNLTEVEGNNLSRLTDYDDSMSEFSPSWSPDGERIAFQVQFSARNGQRTEIHVREADLTSHTISRDPTSNDYFPVWSPDGTHIAFIAQRNDTLTLTVMDADGRNRYAPANLPLLNVGSVTWSPNGETIALIGTRRRGSRLFLIDVMQENATVSPVLPEQVSNVVIWSADSTQLAYSLQATDGLYVLTVATETIRQITSNAQTNSILP